MEATQSKLLPFLKKSPQFVIPIYQRTYSWTERQCRQLWDDIIRSGTNDSITAHFVGSIVYVEKGLYQVSTQSPLLVIDGQQRLTTVSLLIEALARAVGDTEPVDGFSAKKLRNKYLLNDEEEDERRFKLLLSQTDRTSLKAILQQQPLPREYSVRIKENFENFQSWILELRNEVRPLCNGLAKLIIVDISLNRDQDNPQLIFESLNSTGLELSQADLIRNYILMGLEPQLQTKLYENYWRPMEVDFGQSNYVEWFDSFVRDYLTLKTGEIPNVSKVYETFKKFAGDYSEERIEDLVSDLRVHASHYCKMALGFETNPKLKEAFHDLRELKVDVAYPFLLFLYKDYESTLLSLDDFVSAIRLIESYVFRRAVCSIPTNSLNKVFATFSRAVNKDHYLESIKAHFLSLPSYRRFPSDEEFHREIQKRDLYNFRSRTYWLRRFENYDRKERVAVEEYTIEHILPQNENLSEEWQHELGPDWAHVQETYLHTLGNLTLTGYNSEYSDRPFAEKREMRGGFKESPLRINQGLASLDGWNEETIRERAETLAQQALLVWPMPQLEQDVLGKYQYQKPEEQQTTIERYSHLDTGPMRDLFEMFRKEVLALDPCITESFLKSYISYKAETNFVDVTPQAKKLWLSINIPSFEIDDPKGACVRAGDPARGYVDYPLSSPDELAYAVGLVRQALERQIGNNRET